MDQLNEAQRYASDFHGDALFSSRQASVARVNLGIDFGTRFTKVCYRDIGTTPSGLIDFSNDSGSEVTNSMIPTRVRLIGDNVIHAGLPEKIFQLFDDKEEMITHLKMRLATLTRNEQLKEFAFGRSWPCYRQAVHFVASLFLCNVIRQSKNQLLAAKADEFRNRTIEWSASVGVPVLLFDTPALAVFEEVLETAWLMAEQSDSPTYDLRGAWEQFLICRNLRRERLHNRVYAIEPCPELCGAMVALVGHRAAQEGIYLFFDVGGGTLDGVSFRYFRQDGLSRIVIFDGRLGALGIEALVRRHPEFDADELRETLFNPDTPAAALEFLEREANEIRQLVGSVVMSAKQFAGLQWLPGGEANQRLPVLLGGGGRVAGFYPESIMSTHEEFGQRSAGVPPYKLMDVPVPDDFDMGAVDHRQFHRFAIAYGLSVPFGERPELRLPSQLQRPEPLPYRPLDPVGVYDD